MNKERITHIKEQLDIIRTYQEPYITERNAMIVEAYNQGDLISDIAKELDWQEKSVKAVLSREGIDYRNNPLQPETTTEEILKLIY